MKIAFRMSLAVAVLAPIDASAQRDDLAYCNTLYDLAVRYCGKAIMGQTKPDAAMIVALDQCQAGNTSPGIATLERKLRDCKVSLPPRR